ncbi:MAG: ferredoxin [Gemmobacter sp.]
MTLAAIEAALAAHHLVSLGAFHPDPADGIVAGTLVLIGPGGAGYWAHVTAQPEWQDGGPDPVDRWSRRVIGRLACDLGGKAHFPFTGPPWKPFEAWALRSGQAWQSPVNLLVHATQGLWVSYRGALALPDRLALPPPATRPCDTCADQPCRTACPPAALTPAGYDVPACHRFLDTGAGQPCLASGCLVRRACPLARSYGRLPEHAAYHMSRFHR